MGIEPSMSVNDFLSSLPPIRKRRRKIWNVVDSDGKIVQGVSASDDLESTAEQYIANKYPGMKFTLVFTGWRGRG